ncbi:YdcF family protein [Amycolatopsis carbonis]|uniref:YdcF family protein n=1 Tax=Amycolatopsis carbonis TaxID=715471 RepID=A0A9Y2IMH2_9PSEU|nr:YdcF family protein [Amycolatopsis sp. 2-15]WIX81726.1 YdcF family protein [Amycolatopsis sp. 2-15]
MSDATIPDEVRADVETLWNYHRVDDELAPVDLAIGLGSHDPSVATYTAELYGRGLFPCVIFTGANAPTTVERFPRGEAVHYRELAIEAGMPDEAILVEPDATNTAENFEFSRKLVESHNLAVGTALILSRPYQQRRAYATAKKLWPKVDFLCSAVQQTIDDYVKSIGDTDRVINMLVGDTQRITVYAQAGYAVEQDVPDQVTTAYERLINAGYTDRLIQTS